MQADEKLKRKLTNIREKHKASGTRHEAKTEVKEFRKNLDVLDTIDPATVIDLMLTYRAIEDWDGMIELFNDMPEILKRQVLVREQLGFAYNRRAGKNEDVSDRAKALDILEEIAKQNGPSSETLGLIGRIHKDLWKEALEAKEDWVAEGRLDQAINAYRRGYLADQRDAYPGINLLTLLDIQGEEESLKEKERLAPVVKFAVEQRLSGVAPDYWDYATMIELAVLENHPHEAKKHLAKAVVAIRETWEPKTTANNLKMIERSRKLRGEETSWLGDIITELEKRASS